MPYPHDMDAKNIHELNIKYQFGLRSDTFNRSALWITNPELKAAHVNAAGTPGRGLAMCCGTGVVGRALVEAGWDMTGVDITPEMVAESSKYFPTINCSAASLPLKNNSFDLVIMRQAYFLLADGPSVLKEAHRLLKPTGRLVLSQTLPFGSVDAEWLRKIHQAKQAQMIRFFTEIDMASELTTHGFEVFEKINLTIRESVSLWMQYAPELSTEVRNTVCEMVLNAPPEYKNLRKVSSDNGEITEDWNWAIFVSRPNKN